MAFKFLAVLFLFFAGLLTGCDTSSLRKSSLDPVVAPASVHAAGAIKKAAAHPPAWDLLIDQEDAKWLPSIGSGKSEFGFSVAVEGDTVVVGARGENDCGAAYVFVREGTDWTQQAKLVASDPTPGADFGFSVAISGDTAIIGAYLAENENKKSTGAAYVFVRQGIRWDQQAKLTSKGGKGFDFFGTSVAMAGNTALVGAFRAGSSIAGAAYVFERRDGAWIEKARLEASDGKNSDAFGISVSLSGNRAIVGAEGASSQGESSGAAYVFVREGTHWVEQAKLMANDGAEYCFLGTAVSLSGDTAVVGAYFGAGLAPISGAAYVFVWNGSTWGQQGKLTASDGASNDWFGISVAVHGDIAVVGALNDDDQGTDSGSAYVFHRSSSGSWSEAFKVLPSDGDDNDELGRRVSLSGNELVVGAPYANADIVQYRAGSAYLFTIPGLQEGGQACSDDAACVSGSCILRVCADEETTSTGAGGGGAGGAGGDGGAATSGEATATTSAGVGGGGAGGADSGASNAATGAGGAGPLGELPNSDLSKVAAAGGGGCGFYAGSSEKKELQVYGALLLLCTLGSLRIRSRQRARSRE